MSQALSAEHDRDNASRSALLLIDVINDFDFPEAEQLLRHAPQMSHAIEQLTQRARELGMPVIYINDNFGRWQSDFRAQVEHCLSRGGVGREIVQRLQPQASDYFVLKPMHSGFYSTTLDLLLRHLNISTLILTGLAADICVLFTGNDAYMRGYRIVVPADCVAANLPEEKQRALQLMQKVLKADISRSSDLSLEQLMFEN